MEVDFDRPTVGISVAALNKVSDVDQQLIVLRERASRKNEGDRGAALQMILCWAAKASDNQEDERVSGST